MASSLVPVSPLCGHLLRRGVCVVSLLLPLSSVAATGMTARAAVAAAVAVGPEALTTAAVYARTRLHGAADVRDQHCCGQSKEGCVHVRRSAWNAGPTQEAGCSTQENQSSAQEGRRKTSERRQSTGEFFAGRLSLPAFRVHCSSSVERILLLGLAVAGRVDADAETKKRRTTAARRRPSKNKHYIWRAGAASSLRTTLQQ